MYDIDIDAHNLNYYSVVVQIWDEIDESCIFEMSYTKDDNKITILNSS